MPTTSKLLLNWKFHRLIPAVALLLVVFYNIAFFRNFFTVYPLTAESGLFAVSLAILVFALLTLLLTLVSSRYLFKPILLLLFPLSALASYFMDSYNVILDTSMMQNIFSTSVAESSDLLSFRLVIYFVLLGVLPAILIYLIKLDYGTFKSAVIRRSALALVAVLLIGTQLLLFSKNYSSFFREHKVLRYYSNPVTYIYSGINYLNIKLANANITIRPIGEDAKIPQIDTERELVVLVIGETARADRFSLNGYSKQTNPLLEQEQVVSFKNVTSCGTATAVSVPCMFSMYTREDYSDKHARDTENLLDVLHHAGVSILWRDNNSDSKAVALRVPYEDYKSPERNTICDIECRDEGMLVGLQEFIDAHPQGDIFIVLHQMGNHGPAYYKRYPAQFEKFTPACHTNELEKCSNEEINNAYDNAILYTDYFLSKVIALLKQNDPAFETAMLYVSDHGESLGENHLYLHGLPYVIAPDAQKRVGAILWLGQRFYEDGLNISKIRQQAEMPFSHDNLFHTVLGLLELDTAVYNREMDILSVHREDYSKGLATRERSASDPGRHQAYTLN